MSDLAIRVEGLGKQYRIGKRERYHSLRDSLARAVRSPFAWLGRRDKGASDNRFWALKDISFEVRQGELVGVIGRNGAGKSTLLKILSRITEPTEGKAEIWGRIGSLLEVGTGFHPELTGRENVYLNGAILGMRRAEIARKFDEIVAFAEVDRFIDTQVKHYSSGMYTRLAFSVAAYLEPEILVVDEVLAVGDAAFQKKCLGKMGAVAKGGRTVIFVSHNMQAITRLCNRGILLDGGRISVIGKVEDVVHHYMSAGEFGPAKRTWEAASKRPGNEITRLCSVRVCDQSGSTTQVVDIRHPVGVEMEYEVQTPGWVLVPNFHVYNADGVCVFVVGDSRGSGTPRSSGRYRSTMWIPGNYLAEGTLSVGAAISTMAPAVVVHFYEADAVAFEVVDTLHGDSARGQYAGPIPGVVRPILQWDTEVVTETEGALA